MVEEVECQSYHCYCPSKVKISAKQDREVKCKAPAEVSRSLAASCSCCYLYWRRGIHWDCGQASVLGWVDNSVVSQQVEIRLGLLQLHLGDGGGVLGDWTIVGVRIEDPVGVWAGGAGVGHADGPSGRGGGAGLVVGLVTARDADGERPHAALSIGPLLSGRGHQ